MIAEDQGFFGAELLVDDGAVPGAPHRLRRARLLLRQRVEQAVHRVRRGAVGTQHASTRSRRTTRTTAGSGGATATSTASTTTWSPEVGEDHPIGRSRTSASTIDRRRRPRFGFIERLEWREPTGRVAIRERRSLLVDLSGTDRYTLDLASTYTAVTDLAFGDTKESTLPGMRPAERLTVFGGGQWSTRGSGRRVGVLRSAGRVGRPLGHPQRRVLEVVHRGHRDLRPSGNPHHPAVWFTRDYGRRLALRGPPLHRCGHDGRR